MATTYKNLAQAQAAYDTIEKQKQRLQRNDYIREQQAVMGVNNYLRQNGYNGGAAESILLRARGNRSDFGSYDAQLADLAAIISRFKAARGRGASTTAQSGRKDSLPGLNFPAYPTAPAALYAALPSYSSQGSTIDKRITGRRY